jgi:hypothetical protein
MISSSFEAKEAFLHQVEEVRARHPGRPLAFALLDGGFLEFWAMRFFLWERFGSHFELSLATRIPAIFVESPKTILRRIASAFFLPVKARSRVRLCADELLQGRTVALNFSARDRRKAFQVSEGEKELAYLAQRIPSLILVPVVFLWRRKRTDRADELVRVLAELPLDFDAGRREAAAQVLKASRAA